ncbi:hypothetical protein SSYRP_v1c02810 [Spiroplasma syrphidicola EA-1]|uniref:Acyltransferase 3 domain-containing protein n=1 Tax=Spiroplasma syrphidicola EA-1 TaxID=1276229 RepID=R4U3A4_9MOLU|nr:acyltransferase [Spiroplasma syrphidicola]AGM25877.1 hypothetical protein SSYRP_v1c02810 [Spiroplasma syrphidicola EA-1]
MSDIKEQKVKRTSQFELLRFLAAFMVVMFHAAFSYGRNDWWYTNVNTILVIPVVLFIFITGFFVVKSKKSRIIKILLMILIYYLLNLLLGYSVIKIFNLNYDFNSLWKYGEGPWWYLWTLPMLYVFIPILNLALQKLNKWYTLITALIIYIFYYYFCHIEYDKIFAPGQLLLFISVYMLGGWWHLYANTFSTRKLVLWIAIAYLIILQIINNVLFATIQKTVFMAIKEGAKDTSQPLTILAAVAVFICFQHINIKYNRFINFLGQLSLPIYLFQGIFMALTEQKILPHLNLIDSTIFKTIVESLIVFAIAMVFGAIIIWPVNFVINNLDNLLTKGFKIAKSKSEKFYYAKLKVKNNS